MSETPEKSAKGRGGWGRPFPKGDGSVEIDWDAEQEEAYQKLIAHMGGQRE